MPNLKQPSRLLLLLCALLLLSACEGSGPDLTGISPDDATGLSNGLPVEVEGEIPIYGERFGEDDQTWRIDRDRPFSGFEPIIPADPDEGGGNTNPLDPKPILPSDPDVWLVELDAETDATDFAALLGLDLLDATIENGVIVVAGVVDPATLNIPGVLSFEPNQESILAFGQDLTMGFFEGHIFTGGDLRGSPALEAMQLEAVQSFATGQGVKVGIVDTGMDAGHPLLSQNVILPPRSAPVGWREIPNGIDDDKDGIVDEAFGHGTFVAGMTRQIAPNATLVPVRALDSEGIGSLADILKALDYLVAQQVDVINLSLSLSQISPLFDSYLSRIDLLGITVVAASGNQAGPTSYPANSPLTLGVAAHDDGAQLAAFSNAGPDCEVAAPGVDVLSSFPAKKLGYGSGTSFACPVVAGAVAVLMEFKAATGPVAESLLLQNCTPLDPIGYGAIDLLGTLEKIGKR